MEGRGLGSCVFPVARGRGRPPSVFPSLAHTDSPPTHPHSLIDSHASKWLQIVALAFSLVAPDAAVLGRAPPGADRAIDGALWGALALLAAVTLLGGACRRPGAPGSSPLELALQAAAAASAAADVSWLRARTAAAALTAASWWLPRAAAVAPRAGRLASLLCTLRVGPALASAASRAAPCGKRRRRRGGSSDTGGEAAPPPRPRYGARLADLSTHHIALIILVAVVAAPFMEFRGATGYSVPGAAVALLAPLSSAPPAARSDGVTAFFAFMETVQTPPLVLPVSITLGNDTWTRRPSPARAADALIVTHAGATALLDVGAANRHAATLSLALSAGVVVWVVAAAAGLGAAASRLVLAPVDRVLRALRRDAAAVAAAVGDDGAWGEDELGMLEAAVSKLAAIVAHVGPAGSRGSAVARCIGVDAADDDTRSWLGTMGANGTAVAAGSGVAGGVGAAGGGDAAAPPPPPRRLETTTSAAALLPDGPPASDATPADRVDSLTAPLPPPPTPADATEARLAAALARAGCARGGLTLPTLDTLAFDALALPATDPDARAAVAVALAIRAGVVEAPPGSPLSAAPAFSSGAPALDASAATLFLFARAVGDAYPPNPYHNFAHALEVTHAAIRLAAAASPRAPLAPTERAALVLAALCHDVGHPGVNNAFLVATRADVARVYNDTSVLEAASVARAYDVAARTPGGDIFAALSDTAAWRDVRRLFIAAILHTDMTHHFPMVSKVEVFVEMNAAALGLAKSGGGGGNGSAPATTAPAAAGEPPPRHLLLPRLATPATARLPPRPPRQPMPPRLLPPPPTRPPPSSPPPMSAPSCWPSWSTAPTSPTRSSRCAWRRRGRGACWPSFLRRATPRGRAASGSPPCATEPPCRLPGVRPASSTLWWRRCFTR